MVRQHLVKSPLADRHLVDSVYEKRMVDQKLYKQVGQRSIEQLRVVKMSES
jgi:hypothetical protein